MTFLRPTLFERPGCLLLVWVAAAILATAPGAGQSLQVLPPTGQWITDRGDFLSPAEERALSVRLASYADTTSTQIVIVTLPSLDGAAASDYAVELGRRWGVGQAGYNNGVVILISREDRQVFIATGYGLEGSIPDAVASRIYRNVLVPHFRQGRFYGGLSQAVDALMLAAAGEFEASQSGRESGGINVALIVVLAILVVFIVIALRDARGGGDGGVRPPRRRRHYGEPPIIILGGPGFGRRTGGWSGGGGFGGGLGGFGGGGGSFGGGGAGGGW